MEAEKVGRSSDMDAVMSYRHYLAAEDHLDELIFRATTSQEKAALKAMQDDVIYLRDHIMPPEADPLKHCLVKHFAAGYEGARERWKDIQDEETYYNKKIAYDLLIDALEMLWERKIITCERCNYGRNETGIYTTSGSGDDSLRGAEYGQSRGTISTISENREPGIQSVLPASED